MATSNNDRISSSRLNTFATELWTKIKNTFYTKPSNGIPKTDLDSSVQTSLGKADSALQSHQSLDGYVNGITEDSTTTFVDSTSIVVNKSGKNVLYRTAIGLWKYIKGKADSVYATLTHYHSASDITSGTFDAARIPNLDASNITSGTFPTARIADDAITATKVKDNETLPCNISGTAKYSRIMNPTNTDTIWGNNSYSGSGGGQHTIIGTLTITTSTHTSGSTTYEASWTNVHENFMFQSSHSGDGIISVYICMPGNTNGGTTNPACVIRCFSAQTSGISNPVKCYLKKGTSGTHYTYTFTLITSVDDYNNCRCFGRLNHPGDTAFTLKTSGNIITDAQLTEETYGTILATCQYNRVGYADGWTTARNFAIADSTSAHTGATSSVNGGSNVTLKLPSTITASLVGDVTGNCSGSSGSCSGNASTATKLSSVGYSSNGKIAIACFTNDSPNGSIGYSSHISTWNDSSNGELLIVGTVSSSRNPVIRLQQGDPSDASKRKYGSLFPETLSYNREWKLPDSSGTIALTSSSITGGSSYTYRLMTDGQTTGRRIRITEDSEGTTNRSHHIGYYNGADTLLKNFIDINEVTYETSFKGNADTATTATNYSATGGIATALASKQGTLPIKDDVYDIGVTASVTSNKSFNDGDGNNIINTYMRITGNVEQNVNGNKNFQNNVVVVGSLTANSASLGGTGITGDLNVSGTIYGNVNNADMVDNLHFALNGGGASSHPAQTIDFF